jgi:hypothetical protein
VWRPLPAAIRIAEAYAFRARSSKFALTGR